MKTQLLVYGALMAASCLWGQTNDLLTHYRTMALEYNHDVIAAEKNIAASVELIAAARTDLLPKVVADASYRFTGYPMELYREIPSLAAPLHFRGSPHQYGAALTLMQPIYMGGQILATIRKAELHSSYASNQRDLVREGVILQTDLCYWNAVAQCEMVRIAEDARGMVEELTAVVQQRVQMGAADPNDLLMAQVKLNEAHYSVVQSKTLLETSLMAFNSLLGVPLVEATEIDSVVIPLRTVPIYVISDTIDRPERRMAIDALSLAVNEEKLVDAKFRPHISVGAEGTYGSPGYNFDPDLNGNYGVYARVSVPLLEWGKRGRVKRAASHRSAMAEEELYKVEQQMALEVASSERTLHLAVEQVILTENSLQQAILNERRALERYAEGGLSVMEILQAQLYRQTAQLNHTQAKLLAQCRWSDLQRARSL